MSKIRSFGPNVNGPHQLFPCVTTKKEPAQPLSAQSVNLKVLKHPGFYNCAVALGS